MRLRKTGGNLLSATECKDIEFIESIKLGSFIDVDIIKKDIKVKRSTKQNAYYWAVVIEMLKRETDNSYSSEDYHFWLKCEILGTKKIGEREIPKFGTSELNSSQMEIYLQRCRDLAWNTFELYIPLPNETQFNY